MTRSATTAAAIVGAAALAAAAFAAPAQAAPNSKGNTEIIPNATLAELLVSADAPVTTGEAGVEFGVVGNPNKGVVKHVGGITITTRTATGSQLELRNFWIDLDDSTVSADVAGIGRLELFDLDLATLTLSLNDTASTAIAGNTGLSGEPVATVAIDEWNF